MKKTYWGLSDMYTKKYIKSIPVGLLFVFIASISMHYLFSWMGFNPSDDGFTLAYSRRILEGQIPHLDFIIIRPFLSPLLHVPIVMFGGEQTFWLSRLFVWFQLTSVAWIWTTIINRFLGDPFTKREQILVALITFVLNINIFPLMAWHTLDGIFFATMGLALTLSKNPTRKFIGYVLIGLAYITKQNYLPVAPGVLIILGDWRNAKNWIAITLPGMLYAALLIATGALPDAIIQLSLQSGFISVGFVNYLEDWYTPIGIIVGLFLSKLLSESSSNGAWMGQGGRRFLGSALLFLVPISISIIPPGFSVLKFRSFFLFGLLLGVLADLFWKSFRGDGSPKKLQIILIVLLTAWSSSISHGYASPGLTSGIMASSIIAYSFATSLTTRKLGRLKLYSLLAACLFIVFAFADARSSTIYREQEASNLVFPLDDLISGGNRIKTNGNTFEYLIDLKVAVDLAQNEGSGNYAIIPDNAGYWVKSQQINPLPIDWPLDAELGSPRLFERVTSSMENSNTNLIIITQKVNVEDLALGFSPLDGHNHSIVKFVQSNFQMIGETDYFELYGQGTP